MEYRRGRKSDRGRDLRGRDRYARGRYAGRMSGTRKYEYTDEIKDYNGIPRIDKYINQFNWVEFIMKLKNNARGIFHSATDAIKKEKVPIFLYPTPPTETTGPLYQIWKSMVAQIHKVAQNYAADTEKAVDILLSEKMMDAEIRIDVENHPLFYKVENNLNPTIDECDEYCLSEKNGYYYNEKSAMKSEISEIDSLEEDKSVVTQSTNTIANTVPIIGGKNVVLLLKIIRSTILKISKDTAGIQIQAFEQCWQFSRPLLQWTEIYKEHVQILESIGINYEDEQLRDHFLERVTRTEILAPAILSDGSKTKLEKHN